MRWLVLGLALLATACGTNGGPQQAAPTTSSTSIAPTTASPTTTTTAAPASTTTTQESTTTVAPPTTAAQPTAAEVFGANCASCHGAELEGGVGPALGPGGHAHGHADAELVDIVANGKNGMPAFGDKLTEEQIVNLVAFIRQADNSS